MGGPWQQPELPGAWDEWAAGAGIADGWMSAPVRLGPKKARTPAPFVIVSLLPGGAGLQVDVRASDNTVWWSGQIPRRGQP
jgi:hypothetical protein